MCRRHRHACRGHGDGDITGSVLSVSGNIGGGHEVGRARDTHRPSRSEERKCAHAIPVSETMSHANGNGYRLEKDGLRAE
jgi:hypothetical protein